MQFINVLLSNRALKSSFSLFFFLFKLKELLIDEVEVQGYTWNYFLVFNEDQRHFF